MTPRFPGTFLWAGPSPLEGRPTLVPNTFQRTAMKPASSLWFSQAHSDQQGPPQRRLDQLQLQTEGAGSRSPSLLDTRPPGDKWLRDPMPGLQGLLLMGSAGGAWNYQGLGLRSGSVMCQTLATAPVSCKAL